MAAGGEGVALPFHRADKKIPTIDAQGNAVKPEKPNGVKFEMFVFDALQLAERSVVLEVDRKLEFSPVKNATGEDSPHTTRADLCGMFAQWVTAAKLPLPAADALGVHPVEIDPLIAEDLATFLARGALAPLITPRGHLYR